MLSATITVDDRDGLVAKSFATEDREIKGKASYRVTSRSGKAVFTIKAEDSTALRTVANSITKMLTIIEKMRSIR